MNKRSLVVLGAAVAAGLAAVETNAAVLAKWTYETSVPTTAGPHAAEVGIGSALGTTGGTYSNPAGPGSNESFSATDWNVGEYWQFSTSSTGYQDITVSFDAMGSNTGPKDFKIAYSTDNTTYTDFATYALINAAWSSDPSFVNPSTAHFDFDFSAITALDNAPTIYFRLIDNSTTAINSANPVGTTGTSRTDNVTINGTLIPEPASLSLMGLGGLAMLGRRKRL
jgi:hypothetical protein